MKCSDDVRIDGTGSSADSVVEAKSLYLQHPVYYIHNVRGINRGTTGQEGKTLTLALTRSTLPKGESPQYVPPS